MTQVDINHKPQFIHIKFNISYRRNGNDDAAIRSWVVVFPPQQLASESQLENWLNQHYRNWASLGFVAIHYKGQHRVVPWSNVISVWTEIFYKDTSELT